MIIPVICARGKSRRFPGKCLGKQYGISLVEIAMRKAELLLDELEDPETTVYLSSDMTLDEAGIARPDWLVEIGRPPDLAGGHVYKWDVWRWIARDIDHAYDDLDAPVLLDIDICRPLADPVEFLNGYDEVDGLSEPAIAVVRSDVSPYQDLLQMLGTTRVTPYLGQYLEGNYPVNVYRHAGFYAIPFSKFERGRMFPANTAWSAVEMSPIAKWDVNTIEDRIAVNALIANGYAGWLSGEVSNA